MPRPDPWLPTLSKFRTDRKLSVVRERNTPMTTSASKTPVSRATNKPLRFALKLIALRRSLGIAFGIKPPQSLFEIGKLRTPRIKQLSLFGYPVPFFSYPPRNHPSDHPFTPFPTS